VVSEIAGEILRSSFLTKRTKKLLLPLAKPRGNTAQPRNQKFFASFFQKRSAFSLAFGPQGAALQGAVLRGSA
jgi:hypothetical protein